MAHALAVINESTDESRQIRGGWAGGRDIAYSSLHDDDANTHLSICYSDCSDKQQHDSETHSAVLVTLHRAHNTDSIKPGQNRTSKGTGLSAMYACQLHLDFHGA